ncbi:MAG: RNA 2',3'-cyclic phosphodiesterase [Alphaproteobacteria bacterium]|nr:RNA 2',3'-cyclic phosphodiesterase [Alphaproteobacteria bacterium]MCB9698501.1 RNA 2',3'-cyclic phosphodiesterase [Alphaproteobacteria bacterium]
MSRCFVAIELPAEVRVTLLARAPSGDGCRPVRDEQLHVTLHFLGERDPDAVIAALRGVAFAPFTLRVGGLGVFEGQDHDSSCWAGLEESDALLALHRDVGRALAAVGFEAETRPYHPHVTLARCKASASAHVEAFRAGTLAPMDVPVSEIALFESVLGPAGPTYTRIWASPHP